MTMNDRFAAQLRQHLLDSANERPADGQLAAVLDLVADTDQRHGLAQRLAWLPGRFGPVPAVVRLGLVAVALVLAALAVMSFAGAPQGGPSTVFEGRWTAIDPADGSRLNLKVGAGPNPEVHFEDNLASGEACFADEVKVFTADGVATISGGRLEASYAGGGCGAVLVAVEHSYVYDPDTDTLVDQDGVTWARVSLGDGPLPTLPAGPSPTASWAFEGAWTATDPGDESTLTLVVGPGTSPRVQFVDDRSTGGACDQDEVKVFVAEGVGDVQGTRLLVSYPDGGGCGSTTIPMGGRYDYDAQTDTLIDQDGVIWVRVPDDGSPTDPPATDAPRTTTSPSACVDLSGGGTYAAPPGFEPARPPVSMTALVPSAPRTPWQGSPGDFHLADACEADGTIAIFAGTSTVRNDDTSCWSQTGEIESFADALARLDTPSGDDISARIDLEIDGYAAARYDITDLRTCSGFGLWGGMIMGLGETGSTYIVDVDGTLFAIELNRDGSQTRAELDEAYAIIASLQIEAATD